MEKTHYIVTAAIGLNGKGSRVSYSKLFLVVVVWKGEGEGEERKTDRESLGIISLTIV